MSVKVIKPEDRNKKYHFFVELRNIEVRRVQDLDKSFDTKDKDGNDKRVETHWIYLTCDDEENEVDGFGLLDKNMENLNDYKRGHFYDFKLRVDYEEGFKDKASMLVVDHKEVEG